MACPDFSTIVLLAGTQVVAFILGTGFGFAVAAWAARRKPIEDTTSCREQPPEQEVDSAASSTELHDNVTSAGNIQHRPATSSTECRHDRVTSAGSNQYVTQRLCLDCGQRWKEDTALNVRRKAVNGRMPSVSTARLTGLGS